MDQQAPVSLDYAQVAATADEEAAAVLAAIDFRKPVSHLLKDDETAARIADCLPRIFSQNYGLSTCTGSCVECGTSTTDTFTVGWQCELVSWRLRRHRHVNVDSAHSLCRECAGRLVSRITSIDRIIRGFLIVLPLMAAVMFLLHQRWVSALLIAITVAVAVTRYGTLHARLPEAIVSRFPIWVRWTTFREYSIRDHPLNRLNIDFSKGDE
jgi:hypothetical protein